MKQVLNGSEIVLECLKEQGVDTVFGYPGGRNQGMMIRDLAIVDYLSNVTVNRDSIKRKNLRSNVD